MKKIVIAVVVVGLLSVAGTALAKPGKGQKGAYPSNGVCWQMNQAGGPQAWKDRPMFQGQGQGQAFGQGRQQGNFGGKQRMSKMDGTGRMGGMRGWNAADMPEDIRSKANELAKLHIDLRDTLSRTPIDRAKATELYGKITQLRQEIGTWAFGQRMNRIEEFRKQQELNRTVPPTAPAKPAPTNS